MAFFQNLFDQEYQGYLVLGDRKHSLTFKVNPNKNLQAKQIAWNPGPYDFSVDPLLEFNFSWDPEFKNWSSVSIDVSGANPASTNAYEVAENLNANSFFNSLFVASVTKIENSDTILITKNSKKNAKIYFGNYGAETKLRFNKNAGVSELPEYFSRHTIQNRLNFSDSVGMLIKLDPSNPVDQSIIEQAGFVGETKEDYELLRGRSGLFAFKKMVVDSSDRVAEVIEYSAGSVAGDLSKKTTYSYVGSNKNPSKVTEIPYVLTDEDIVSP